MKTQKLNLIKPNKTAKDPTTEAQRDGDGQSFGTQCPSSHVKLRKALEFKKMNLVTCDGWRVMRSEDGRAHTPEPSGSTPLPGPLLVRGGEGELFLGRLPGVALTLREQPRANFRCPVGASQSAPSRQFAQFASRLPPPDFPSSALTLRPSRPLREAGWSGSWLGRSEEEEDSLNPGWRGFCLTALDGTKLPPVAVGRCVEHLMKLP